jgi:hypothetical protein
MTHTKGEQVEFKYITVGNHYIIEESSGRELYVNITALELVDNTDEIALSYRIIKVCESSGQWTPFSLSLPYHPKGTIRERDNLKVYATEQPPPRRRRRGFRDLY